jgi:hypothetical protein
LLVPATKLDIANHLGVLIKSFPNAGRSDAAVPAECWWKDVGAQRPTIGGGSSLPAIGADSEMAA